MYTRRYDCLIISLRYRIKLTELWYNLSVVLFSGKGGRVTGKASSTKSLRCRIFQSFITRFVLQCGKSMAYRVQFLFGSTRTSKYILFERENARLVFIAVQIIYGDLSATSFKHFLLFSRENSITRYKTLFGFPSRFLFLKRVFVESHWKLYIVYYYDYCQFNGLIHLTIQAHLLYFEESHFSLFLFLVYCLLNLKPFRVPLEHSE